VDLEVVGDLAIEALEELLELDRAVAGVQRSDHLRTDAPPRANLSDSRVSLSDASRPLDAAQTELEPRARRAVGIQLVRRICPVIAPPLGLRLRLIDPSTALSAPNLARARIDRKPLPQVGSERRANIIP
jgi:hypothetical protein